MSSFSGHGVYIAYKTNYNHLNHA